MKYLYWIPFLGCFLPPLLLANNLNFELASPEDFEKYWYQTGAELTRYDLKQSRYGEIHQGYSILIFVTEPFNPELQVKADENRKNNIPVLKLNAIRKFNTGLYDYSTMTSTFLPINITKNIYPLKSITTVQEWCGMAFSQLNLKGDKYQVQSRSYFESESDKNFNLPASIKEEALFNLIRVNPNKLPQGKINVIPNTLYTRLAHVPLETKTADAHLTRSKEKSLQDKALAVYTLSYTDKSRVLEITFETEFPFKIQKWQETYPGIMGGKELSTTAVQSHQIKSAYWGKHKNKDRALLKKLGLTATD